MRAVWCRDLGLGGIWVGVKIAPCACDALSLPTHTCSLSLDWPDGRMGPGFSQGERQWRDKKMGCLRRKESGQGRRQRQNPRKKGGALSRLFKSQGWGRMAEWVSLRAPVQDSVAWWRLRAQEGPHLSPVFLAAFTCTVSIEWANCLHDVPALTMPPGTGQSQKLLPLVASSSAPPSLASQHRQQCCEVAGRLGSKHCLPVWVGTLTHTLFSYTYMALRMMPP